MHKNGYELETALRGLVELRQEAAHAKLVAELKKIKRVNHQSLWRKVIANLTDKPGRRTTTASTGFIYGGQPSPIAARDE